jgi:hypothetical protein
MPRWLRNLLVTIAVVCQTFPRFVTSPQLASDDHSGSEIRLPLHRDVSSSPSVLHLVLHHAFELFTNMV